MIGRLINVEQLVQREMAGDTEALEENLASLTFCPPQISHNLAWN
jgi:hypothetical protein